MKVTPAPMNDEEYQLLNELLRETFGLDFPQHKREILESRLRPRLVELSLRSYYDYYLQARFGTGAERAALATAVTNNETYFFRETAPIEALFAEALGGLLEGSSTPKQLAILSVGCSSGEEPYTLGIYAKESQYRMWGATTRIDAFDLDQTRIAVARSAVYSASSLRVLDEARIEKYFSAPTAAGRPLKPAYRTGVSFCVGNLLDLDTYPSRGPYDALFCRNVLIYFDEASLRRAIATFARVLRPDALLFLGHSESIIGMTRAFEAVPLGEGIVYRRTTAPPSEGLA